MPPTADFDRVFASSAAGRSVSSRLTLDHPPEGLALVPWPVRFADFDVMNHINNALAFAIVEEVLAGRRDLRAPLRVEVDYRSSIDRVVNLSLGGIDRGDSTGADGHSGWLVDDSGRCPLAFRIGRPPLIPTEQT